MGMGTKQTGSMLFSGFFAIEMRQGVRTAGLSAGYTSVNIWQYVSLLAQDILLSLK